MKSPAITAVALLASACATSPPDANIYGCCIGQHVVGNSAYVTVSNVYNEMDALPLAERHCKAHRKVARFSRMEGARAIFDCVNSN